MRISKAMSPIPSSIPSRKWPNLMEAARAYQMNVAAVQATKGMISASLDILR